MEEKARVKDENGRAMVTAGESQAVASKTNHPALEQQEPRPANFTAKPGHFPLHGLRFKLTTTTMAIFAPPPLPSPPPPQPTSNSAAEAAASAAVAVAVAVRIFFGHHHQPWSLVWEGGGGRRNVFDREQTNLEKYARRDLVAIHVMHLLAGRSTLTDRLLEPDRVSERVSAAASRLRGAIAGHELYPDARHSNPSCHEAR